MSHVEKLLRLKDFSESFALTAAECIADRKTGIDAFAGSAGRETVSRKRPAPKGAGRSLFLAGNKMRTIVKFFKTFWKGDDFSEKACIMGNRLNESRR